MSISKITEKILDHVAAELALFWTIPEAKEALIRTVRLAREAMIDPFDAVVAYIIQAEATMFEGYHTGEHEVGVRKLREIENRFSVGSAN